MTTTGLSKFRASQLAVSSGLGTHLVSPEKRAPKRKLATTATIFFDLQGKKRRAQKELDELLSRHKAPVAAPGSDKPASSSQMEVDPSGEEEWEDEVEAEPGPQASNKPVEFLAFPTKPSKAKRLVPDIRSLNLYCKWRVLLPTLVEPLLAYTADSIGKAARAVEGDLAAACQEAPFCEISETIVLCLYFDRM